MNSKSRIGVTSALVVAWGLVMFAGFKVLEHYAHAPGSKGVAAARWPANDLIQLASDRPTLVLFAHPKCPCSRASLHELDTLMARVGGEARLKTYVVFVEPKGWTDAQTKSNLWQIATRTVGVETLIDPLGRAAQRFGALTSGHVFLYSARGKLVFSGGITASRGHEGDNAGLAAAAGYVLSGKTALRSSHVFGCALFDAHGDAG